MLYWWKLILLYWYKRYREFSYRPKCNNCLKAIPSGGNIFYYNDHTFCTGWCRYKQMNLGR